MATHDHTEPQTPIPGTPGYAATMSGEIVNTRTGRTLKPFTSRGGYRRVDLPAGRFYVHTLVANTFLGGIPDGHVVTHKDGDRDNNRADNLEITTKSALITRAWNLKRGLANA